MSCPPIRVGLAGSVPLDGPYGYFQHDVTSAGEQAFDVSIGAQIPTGYLIVSVGYNWTPANAGDKFYPQYQVASGYTGVIRGYFEGPGTFDLFAVVLSGAEMIVGQGGTSCP